MIVSDLLAGLGLLCLLSTLAIIAAAWWQCHVEVRAERRRAALRRDWLSSRPEQKL